MKIAIMVIAKKKPQSGMSLVELMVAMVIGLFLTAGVFTMFNMSSSNVTTTSQLNQLQENGRIALAILEKDLSQLAFMGDMTGTDFIVGTNTNVEVAALTSDCVGAGLNNATLPNNTPAHFRRLWGYEQGASSTVLTCLADVKAVNAQTDVLQMKRLIGPPNSTPSGNNIFVATDANQAVFFTPPVPASATAMVNARYWEYQHHVYFIADDTAKIPLLRRKTLTATGMNNDEQLVEGIENLRVLYGFDNDGDGTPDSFMPANSVTDLMWDNQGFQRLVALKVYLLVRAIQADRSYTNQTQYTLGDKTLPVFKDNFRRKVMSTTVVLENPALIRN
ncbi:MAG: PilW family protein [Shewanella sp.]